MAKNAKNAEITKKAKKSYNPIQKATKMAKNVKIFYTSVNVKNS